VENGSAAKFVPEVRSISFSAARAVHNGQKVMYITERCVFELTEKGLRLTEVYPGIDLKKDILDLLPFEVELGPGIAGPAKEGRKE
jgi:propionate CoA-transferase